MVETHGKLAALGRLSGAELQNRTEVIAKSVLDKVPNSDRVFAAQMLTSLFCQILNESALTDKEKLDRFDKFTERVTTLINPTPPAPATPQAISPTKRPKLAELRYGDEKRNGRTITLEHGCDPSACVKMHVWPWPNPDSFGLYGVWMPRPSVEISPFTNGRLFLEFSEAVSLRSGSGGCSSSFEKPHAGYKVAFICGGGPGIGEARWILPFFNFVPVPSGPLHIRAKFEYGDIQSDAAAFVLRPPD